MFFSIGFYISLAIFAFGLIYKITAWFRYNLGPDEPQFATHKRVLATGKGIILVVFSPKIVTLLKVFLLDVLFQLRTLKESRFRWLMHILIFWGFLLLLLMHGLERFITSQLFENYYPTLNPFLFLRNLFALFVLAGIALAFYRRFIVKIPRLKAHVLATARNLSLAEREGLNILTLCNCCFGTLKHINHTLKEDEFLRKDINRSLEKEGLSYSGAVENRHLLDLFHQDVGIHRLKQHIVKRFADLKIATHYGCHILRPRRIAQFDNPANPTYLTNWWKQQEQRVFHGVPSLNAVAHQWWE